MGIDRKELESLAQAKVEQLRRSSYDDLYFFTKYVLGYNDLEPQPHRELCDFFMTPDIKEFFTSTRQERVKRAQENGNIKRLCMVPRGCFKSTVGSIAFPPWALWHDPTLRILLDNEAYKNSKKFLSEMKGHISGNELLRQLAVDEDGKYVLDPLSDLPGGWTEDSFKLTQTKEPSVWCSGVDTASTGMHPDIIIADDLVSERNVTTEDQIEKVKQHYRMYFSLLEPGGILIIIGTRYHTFDLYGEILDKEADTYKILYRPAVTPKGELFFPTRLSQKRLDELKKSQGIYIFNSQYMLHPLSSENAIFRPEWIKYYTDKELPRKLNTFITVDLAISKKETADYTVVMVHGVDQDSNVYVLDYARGRYTPQETSEEVFRLAAQYKPMKIGVEAVAFQRAMIYFLRDEMRRRGKFLPVVELKADRDKVRRAQAIQPWFENGAFFIKKEMTELENELLEFPLGKHDDLVDAMSYIVQIMRKPGRSEAKKIDTVYTPANTITGY